MLFVKERLSSWIQATIILVVGILCIVAGAAIGGNNLEAAKNTIDAMNIVIGIVLIVVGSLSLILSVLVAVLAKKGFAAVAAPGAILVALGASILVWKYFYNFIDILIKVIPFLLIALGVIVLADAIFTYILALKAKEGKKALLGLIVGCLVAVVDFVLPAQLHPVHVLAGSAHDVRRMGFHPFHDEQEDPLHVHLPALHDHLYPHCSRRAGEEGRMEAHQALDFGQRRGARRGASEGWRRHRVKWRGKGFRRSAGACPPIFFARWTSAGLWNAFR